MSTEITLPRVSLIATMANRFSMDPKAFEQTIRATVMPDGASNEQMAAFLMVANSYGLNPITKEIYAFRDRNGGITPVVGIDGWIHLAQEHPQFDGMEHAYRDDDNGKPYSVTCRVWRKDHSRPTEITEFFDECRRDTAPWRSHPRRMLRHKATIQAIRYAFGFAGIRDEDDADFVPTGPGRIVAVAELDKKVAEMAEETKKRLPKPAPAEKTTTEKPPAEPAGNDEARRRLELVAGFIALANEARSVEALDALAEQINTALPAGSDHRQRALAALEWRRTELAAASPQPETPAEEAARRAGAEQQAKAKQAEAEARAAQSAQAKLAARVEAAKQAAEARANGNQEAFQKTCQAIVDAVSSESKKALARQLIMRFNEPARGELLKLYQETHGEVPAVEDAEPVDPDDKLTRGQQAELWRRRIGELNNLEQAGREMLEDIEQLDSGGGLRKSIKGEFIRKLFKLGNVFKQRLDGATMDELKELDPVISAVPNSELRNQLWACWEQRLQALQTKAERGTGG